MWEYLSMLEPDTGFVMPTHEPGELVKIPTVMGRMHHGQHDESCFPCKIATVHFGAGPNPTHVKNGDPWKDNPVVDRIKELTGVEINTDVPRAPGAA